MAQEESSEIEKIFAGRKLPVILGDEAFVEWVKGRFFGEKVHREVPESKLLAPEREQIRAVVGKAYGISEEQLLKSRRGKENEGRNVAIYLTRQLRGERLAVICEEYGLRKESSAGSVIEKVQEGMKRDRRLRSRVEKIERRLIKSYPET